MEYFREREWRIVPNLALAGGTRLYLSATKQQVDALRSIDAEWCDKMLLGKKQVEHCRVLQKLQKQDIRDRIRRIIVTADQFELARKIAGTYNFDDRKIARIEDTEFSNSSM